MKRVNAVEHYFFSREYFHRFLAAEDFTAFLLLAYREDQLTAGAVFTVTNNIMQYHLAGTKEQYMKATPMKLVLDEARLLGTKMGLRFLHLGGGVGGSNDDSLYRFKSGFSDIYFTYKVWRVIVDDIKYKELVAINLRERKLNTNYFPLYRG
jgi:lipid II:glycine glycyltransferase (peptidoglycan interpeptide bridge formation enzyme)